MDALTQYYKIQTSLLRQTHRREELKDAVRQAKYDLRAAEEALLNYEGGLRAFFDKFSGRREEKTEVLSRQVRQQQAKRDALLREREAAEQEITVLTESLASLPSLEVLREAAGEICWASLEASYCAEALLPLLEGNREALLEYRALIRGERMEVLSVERQQAICTGPNRWAVQCRPLVFRLKEAMDILQIPFEVGGYYNAPESFLVNVAAKHNRLDRVNQALDQVELANAKCKMIERLRHQ